jgi:hypothetical protein
MRNRGLFALILSVSCAASPVLAADRAGNFAVKGVGQASCQDFINASRARRQEAGAMLHWLAGYLAAANQYEADTYDLLSWQNDAYLAQALAGYCIANPKTPFAGAAVQLVRSLRATRLRTSTPLRTIAVPGQAAIRIPGEVVRRAKAELRARKFFAGAIDDQVDPAFLQALGQFQAANRLPATSLPDQRTLFALLGSPAAVPGGKR